MFRALFLRQCSDKGLTLKRLKRQKRRNVSFQTLYISKFTLTNSVDDTKLPGEV